MDACCSAAASFRLPSVFPRVSRRRIKTLHSFFQITYPQKKLACVNLESLTKSETADRSYPSRPEARKAKSEGLKANRRIDRPNAANNQFTQVAQSQFSAPPPETNSQAGAVRWPASPRQTHNPGSESGQTRCRQEEEDRRDQQAAAAAASARMGLDHTRLTRHTSPVLL